eukprot:COSAG04_NODE_25898_length_302_cov_0.719212_1_plen_28_part_10
MLAELELDVWCRLTGATKLPALLKAVGR